MKVKREVKYNSSSFRLHVKYLFLSLNLHLFVVSFFLRTARHFMHLSNSHLKLIEFKTCNYKIEKENIDGWIFFQIKLSNLLALCIVLSLAWFFSVMSWFMSRIAKTADDKQLRAINLILIKVFIFFSRFEGDLQMKEGG